VSQNWGECCGPRTRAALIDPRYAGGMVSPNTPVLMIIATIAASLLGIIIWVLIWWAIIRGAVLSALRKHHAEVRGPVQELYRGE